MSDRKNGWRSGNDPVQRRLRIITAIAMLVTFAALTVMPERGAEDLAFAGLALAALLILLGYEGLVRLPGIGRRRDDDPE